MKSRLPLNLWRWIN